MSCWIRILQRPQRFSPPTSQGGIKRGPEAGNKTLLVARISMIFPLAPVAYQKPRVVMTIEIMDNKVEHLASVLFGVHLETNAGRIYVYLPGGTKILPNPKFTIRGCQPDQICSTFGSEIHQGIVANPDYQDEVKQGYSRTDCVSMLIL